MGFQINEYVKMIFQKLFNLFIYKIWKLIHGLNNIQLFFNNQMIIWVCVFFQQML